ncbi:hypothetical protein [Planococcus shenhongbingii]|uniref:F-box domain-containing protein n=1 Tax=Planococcus shenhongbingii TaxID=3058398 RepID=A0ABT8NGY1_9BACL|nr:hypothetical protein [Planococcus sp. N017]MDN7247086.1 hypothetical protein [Planococcus sp. N017]
MKNEMNLFTDIAQYLSILDLPEEKSIKYKRFDFRKEEYGDLIKLLAGIQHIIDEKMNKNYILLEKRLLEAQDSLIEALEEIYSERINYNAKLKSLVLETIVPYYQGRFEIGLSREISLLPLELRLYIYANLLRREASPLRQVYLLNRIALTLHKADERFLGNCTIYIYAWAGHLFSNGKQKMETNIKHEVASIEKSVKIRKKIYQGADLTPESSWQEFWYGFKLFSDLKNMHNTEVAKICFEIFTTYYENSFALLKEAKPMILKYYKTKNPTEINKLLKKEGLLEVEFKKGYGQFYYPNVNEITLNNDETEKLNSQQKKYAKEKIENKIEGRYLYIRPSNNTSTAKITSFPEQISQNEASEYLNSIFKLLAARNISLKESNEIFINFTTSVMNSMNWDLKMQNFVIGMIGNLYQKLLLRNKERLKELIKMLQITSELIKEDSPHLIVGEGWPVALFINTNPYSTHSHLIYYSNNNNLPDFIGYYNNVEVPLNRLTIETIESILDDTKGMRTRWQRIEESSDIEKSVYKKRNKYWVRMRNERNKILKIN